MLRQVEMGNNQAEIYATDHLYIVAFLVCSGHRVIGTSRHGGRVQFEFHKSPAVCSDVSRFMAGAAVPARQYSFEILRLKRTLHGGK